MTCPEAPSPPCLSGLRTQAPACLGSQSKGDIGLGRSSMEGDIGWVRLLSSRPAALSESPGGLGCGSAVPSGCREEGWTGGRGLSAPPGLPPPSWPRPSSQTGLTQSPAQRRTRGDGPALFVTSQMLSGIHQSQVLLPNPVRRDSLVLHPRPHDLLWPCGRAATVPVAQVRNQAQSGQGAAQDLGPARAVGQWHWPGRLS